MKQLEVSKAAHSLAPKVDDADTIRNDRDQLLQFKNLPSLREKLDSMKTKLQKAQRDPKFNIAPAPLKSTSSAAEMRVDIR